MMKIQSIPQLLPKLYLLMLPAAFLPVLHIPYFVLPDMHIDLMLWYFYIVFSNRIPHFVALLLFGLARDLLNYDMLFISALSYIVFCRLALLCSIIIAQKTFLKLWLGYIISFTTVYVMYLLIKSFMMQHLLFSFMSIVELVISYAAYPLMHCAFHWLEISENEVEESTYRAMR